MDTTVGSQHVFSLDILSYTQQNHPDLENVYFIDRLTNERIHPNGQTVDIDNDMFSGKMLIMIRTGDADEKVEPKVTGGTASNDKVSNYLRPKKRRFEIQLQVKFKKIPDSRIYLGVGYKEPVNLGILQKSFLSGALRFCKMKNPTFSYSLTGKESANENEIQQGMYERPYFAFPIETSLDRISITKKGEKVPDLGGAIHEDKELILKRKEGEAIEYNTEDTYTLCLWNAYIDFVQWKAMNLPAVPRFSLAHVNDAQPMTVKIYSLKSTESDKHYVRDIDTIFDVEVSRRHVTSVGSGAREWMDKRIGNDTDDDSLDSYYTAFPGMDAPPARKSVKKICCCIH